jgi:hypothetical protein
MRILKAESGEQLCKAIQIKVFSPQNKRSALQVHRAPFGKGISADGIDMILAQTAEKIERIWPSEEYGLVTLGPTSFNFVWRNSKTQADTECSLTT